MTLELQEEERAEIEALVAGRMSDLLMEIVGTRSSDRREVLTRRAIVLRKVLDSLGHPEPEAEAPERDWPIRGARRSNGDAGPESAPATGARGVNG